MAGLNGGIIGVDNEPVQATQAAQVTTFNSSGTLTTQPRTTELQYVVIAGGGGGGNSIGGGGGAGGYRSSVPGESSGGGASAESTTPVSGGSPYPVTVGAGGAGGPAPLPEGTPGFNYPTSPGFNGSASTLGTPSPITTVGGGAGFITGYVISGTQNSNGGSGGGGRNQGAGQPFFPVGFQGTANEGYPGGNNTGDDNSTSGGGGAGAAGGTNSPYPSNNPAVCGNGGVGVESSITGSPVYRAGGGGGGGRRDGTQSSGTVMGTGGNGGGGDGGIFAPFASPTFPAATDGTANTGGGGGGSALAGVYTHGKNGGSGVVIVKEPEVTFVTNTSGMWSMDAVYTAVKGGNWTNA